MKYIHGLRMCRVDRRIGLDLQHASTNLYRFCVYVRVSTIFQKWLAFLSFQVQLEGDFEAAHRDSVVPLMLLLWVLLGD